MLDNIVSLNKEYLLLGDFNIDLMFPKHRWNSIISSFNLQQLIKYPTRVCVNTFTLLDHIKFYVDVEICVVQCGLGDHFPICITLGFDKVKSGQKIIMRFGSEILIILILTLYNCGYRFLLLSLINMLHIALKELKLDSHNH